MKKSAVLLGCLGVVVLAAVILGGWAMSNYNRLVGMDEAVKSQWAQVENVYQRRYDLIPNLVRTVQGSADFEKSTLQAVIDARSRVGQVVAPQAGPAGVVDPTASAQAFQQFEAAQGGLSSALSRLLVVVERYPELKANQNFLDLQSQLEGTENRIAVERGRYNETAQVFNAAIRNFPTNLIARMFSFTAKEYFKATAGADQAPAVEFEFGTTTR